MFPDLALWSGGLGTALRRPLNAGAAKALRLGAVMAIGAFTAFVDARDASGTVPAMVPRLGLRPGQSASTAPPPAIREFATRAVARGDPQGLPFFAVDKTSARLHAFDARGRWVSSVPVLLGAARGDSSAKDIGNRPLRQVRPHERTTAAGRFEGELGRNLEGEQVIWIDYDAALSMHRVRARVPRERRLERLASTTPSDNRISYGCINVPEDYFDSTVLPPFRKHARLIVYVMPEVLPVRRVIGGWAGS